MSEAENTRASALDLASKTGLTFGAFGAKPQSVTWMLGRSVAGTRGQRGLKLMRLLLDHLKEFRPRIVFIEAPLSPAVLMSMNSVSANSDTAVILPGFVMVAETVCASLGIESITYDRQAVLKHFTGRASYREKLDGKDAAKKACVARCAQLGWAVDDYEQADAAALWDYGGCLNFSRAAQVMMDRPAPRLGLPEPSGSRRVRSKGSRTATRPFF